MMNVVIRRREMPIDGVRKVPRRWSRTATRLFSGIQITKSASCRRFVPEPINAWGLATEKLLFRYSPSKYSSVTSKASREWERGVPQGKSSIGCVTRPLLLG